MIKVITIDFETEWVIKSSKRIAFYFIIHALNAIHNVMPNDSGSEYFSNTSKSFRVLPSHFQIKIVAYLEVLCTGGKH